MKRKLFLIVSTLSILLISVSLINAANGVSIAATHGTLRVGESTTVTVSAGSSYSFSGDAYSSGAGTGGLSNIGLFGGASQNFTVTATSVGTITVTVSGKSAHDSNPETGLAASDTIYITVVGSGGGNGGSGNNGGTGGGNTGTNEGTYNPNVNPETPEEKEAREAREKEEALEAEKKLALIDNIEIISKSEKRKDKVLKTIESENEKYDYSYDLPSFVEDVEVKVNAADDVTLDYVKEQKVSEDKELVIKASRGEISQEYKVKLNSAMTEDFKVEDGFIYRDEVLNKSLEDLGFKASNYEKDGKTYSMFTKDKLNVQMIANEEQEAMFYSLDEKGTLLDKGQVVSSDKDVLFVLSEVSDAYKSESLYGETYDLVETEKPAFFEELDSNLKVKQVASGWNFEDGVLVSAKDSNLNEDMYHIASEKPFKAAIIAFDKEGSQIYKIPFFVALGGFVAVSITLIAYYLNNKKKYKKKNMEVPHVL